MADDKYGTVWDRRESTLALFLYCQIPFAKTKANNPHVVQLAKYLGRTPSSVARKLGNFGAFDPLLASQGISGLAHGSRTDRSVWEEYYKRWGQLVEVTHTIVDESQWQQVFDPQGICAESNGLNLPIGPSEKVTSTHKRRHQSFFRRAILASYETQCCICGLDNDALLTASHIIPWSEMEALRADPENGLCLCAIHDRAFDRGLLTVRPSLEVVVSVSLMKCRLPISDVAFHSIQGKQICLPRRFAPRVESLLWHNENVFKY